MTMGMLAIGMIGALVGTPQQQQLTACQDAQIATARDSPAAPGLRDLCGQYRSNNVDAGLLLVDAMPPDAALRVRLADTGNRIIAGDTSGQLAAAASKLGPDQRRGFAIGVKVGAGSPSGPGYASAIRSSLNADMAQGFDLGLKSFAALRAGGGVNQKGSGSTDGEILGMPTAVAIGVGVGILGVAGVLAYKFLR